MTHLKDFLSLILQAKQRTTSVCCHGGATNKPSAMCRHQRQFQRDEQPSAAVLFFNNKTNSGGGEVNSGKDFAWLIPSLMI